MSKSFNIHDWQAKQRQQRLTENDDAYQKRQDDMTPGKNPDYFYDDNFKKLKKKYSGAQGSMDNADIQSLQNLVQKYSLDKILVTLGIVGDRALPTRGEDMNESLNPEVSRSLDKFIRAMADRYDYTMQDAVYAIMAALKQRNYEFIDEHHAGDYNPGFLKQSVSTFLDKLKKKTDEGPDYETVEKIMEKHFYAKKANEASTVGTGVLFKAGNSMAHLGKKKKDN
jgi:hypothetical protein